MSRDRRRKGTEKRTCTGFREEGDEKATLHLAWKICKVLIAFYNYLGAGRLSYPIHSCTTLAYHPLLCFLAPSAFLSWGFFFLVFSLSLFLPFPSLSPSYSGSLAPAIPSLSPSHPRAFSVSFATELTWICVRVSPLCGLPRTFSCVYTWASKKIVILASYTMHIELREILDAIYSNIKNNTIVILKWKN